MQIGLQISNKISEFIRFTIPFFLSHPLWSGCHRIDPFIRFFWLQFRFAIGFKTVIVPWFNGLRLPLRPGYRGLTGNYYLGLHEFRDMAFLIHILRPGDLFVDVGSNLGSYSLLASGVSGSRSIAFEPDPSSFEQLCFNVELNSISSLVDCKHLALSCSKVTSQSDSVWFSVDQDTCNSLVCFTYDGKKAKVSVSTLDKELSGEFPQVLKIDVEGSELQVILGARHLLSSDSCLALIVEGFSQEVTECLAGLGFMSVGYDPFSRSILLRHKPKSTNSLWMRKSRIPFIMNRLQSASTYHVYGSRI